MTKDTDDIEIIDVKFVREITKPNSFPTSFNPLFIAFPVSYSICCVQIP